ARIEVLGARAVNGGKRLAIHINLLVALQKPDAPVALHVRMLADVMAASAHLEDMERLSGDRRLPVPLRVEVARILQRLVDRTIGEAPYHLGERRLPGVGKLKAGGTGERHGPEADVAVVGHSAGQRREPLIAEPDAEEIAQGSLDARLWRPIPVDAQDGLPEGIAVGGRDLDAKRAD